MKTLLWILSSVFISNLALARDYIIQKGDHYSSPRRTEIFMGETMRFKAHFNDTAKYDLGNEDQLDTNKLFGTSDCGNTHQENSARFGWRWNNNRLEIMAYTHIGGEFQYQLIGPASLNKIYDYQISLSDDKGSYLFTFNGNTVSMPRGCRETVMKGYKLHPYFGGNQTATHDMSIKIEEGDDFANFSVENLYPNPTKDQTIYLDLNVVDNLSIGFKIYDLSGRLVQLIDLEDYSGEQKYSKIKIPLNNLAAGMYLIQPFAMVGGEEKAGFVASKGYAMKFIVL